MCVQEGREQWGGRLQGWLRWGQLWSLFCCSSPQSSGAGACKGGQRANITVWGSCGACAAAAFHKGACKEGQQGMKSVWGSCGSCAAADSTKWWRRNLRSSRGCWVNICLLQIMCLLWMFLHSWHWCMFAPAFNFIICIFIPAFNFTSGVQQQGRITTHVRTARTSCITQARQAAAGNFDNESSQDSSLHVLQHGHVAQGNTQHQWGAHERCLCHTANSLTPLT